MAPHAFIKPACNAIVSEHLRCHSFWRPAVPYFLNTCRGVKLFAVLSDHYNAQVSCKYRTAQAGLNIATKKKCELCMFFCCTKWMSDHHHSTQGAQNHHLKACLIVLCQVHHPFITNSLVVTEI